MRRGGDDGVERLTPDRSQIGTVQNPFGDPVTDERDQDWQDEQDEEGSMLGPRRQVDFLDPTPVFPHGDGAVRHEHERNHGNVFGVGTQAPGS
jgi:hypothetical protein